MIMNATTTSAIIPGRFLTDDDDKVSLLFKVTSAKNTQIRARACRTTLYTMNMPVVTRTDKTDKTGASDAARRT
jgi:hypothetical protein